MINKKLKQGLVLGILALSLLGAPRTASAGVQGIHLSYSGVFLGSSTRQGGSGPTGSTILTQGDLLWNFSWFGLGVLFQFDKQGANQTDMTFGPKLEFHFGPFYFEGAYAPMAQRAFTDRSIAKQTGSAMVFGAGVRFMLSAATGPTATGFFFQASYKYRIQTIKSQDDVPLGESITQSDAYPLVGLGWVF